jgi:hypothetical protein
MDTPCHRRLVVAMFPEMLCQVLENSSVDVPFVLFKSCLNRIFYKMPAFLHCIHCASHVEKKGIFYRRWRFIFVISKILVILVT